MITIQSYLRGEWVKGSGKAATLVNPATEEAVAETSTEGLDLAGALTHAREVGGPALRAMTFGERGAMLKAMSKTLYEVRDALIEASILNAGTTRSDAKFDIDGATGTLAYYAALGEKLGAARELYEGEGGALTRSPRFWGRHVKHPRLGVAVHVNAFNFPAWGLAEKAAVALLAGVPVVSKPATSTALLAFRVMERLVESKTMAPGALQLVSGSAGKMLDALGPQDLLCFTGSGSTGEMLRGLRSVLHHSVRVNVEADSLNAAVLGPDVEVGSDTWGMCLRDVAREVTQKTGQKCTATRRLFVPAARMDEVIAALAERVSEVRIGNPALEEVRMGPLATRQQLEDARAGVAKLVAGGAKIAHGSATECSPVGVPAGKGYFIAPVILRADDAEAAKIVHQHEVFAPVITVMPYNDAAHAAKLVGLGEGSLLSMIYSDDRAFIGAALPGIAVWSGRVLVGSAKIAEQAIPPGAVLPSCIHGGPGRAGGGEELGGERALDFYMQRTAVQGDRALIA